MIGYKHGLQQFLCVKIQKEDVKVCFVFTTVKELPYYLSRTAAPVLESRCYSSMVFRIRIISGKKENTTFSLKCTSKIINERYIDRAMPPYGHVCRDVFFFPKEDQWRRYLWNEKLWSGTEEVMQPESCMVIH